MQPRVFALILTLSGMPLGVPHDPAHIFAAAAAGPVYYVAPTGSDANSGTLEQPWRTVQKAAETLTAGETVYIRGGIYRERVEVRNSGAPDAAIVISSYPGETAVIDGSDVDLPEWAGLFEVVGRSHVRVSGLEIRNAGPMLHNTGLLAENSSDIIFEGCFISNTRDSGIAVWNCRNVLIENNEIERACTGGFNESLTVGGTDGFEVSLNRVHDSRKEGITLKDGSSNGRVWRNEVHHTDAVGLYVDAQDKHTFNIEVEANDVHDVEANGIALASERGGLLENIRVVNNVAYRNTWVGLHIMACCEDAHPLRGILVVNNTFFDNGRGEWGGGILLENPQAREVVIRNNICSRNLSFQIAVAHSTPAWNYDLSHNLIDGFRDGEDEVRGDDFMEGDPRFSDAARGDFHIQPGSPAVDRGNPEEAPDRDFDGDPRPYGAGYDIGADECIGAARKNSKSGPRPR